MLTGAQFREIADSLRDIVAELKKMNEPTIYNISTDELNPYFGSFEDENMYREVGYRGPTIA
ncbi:hypothetical protein BKG71_19480 [Mycobacteroides chelonae]|uniref:hypothetical protein n=1 Tax=Mycobacteroides chelonae TaxID=1774 RepID=UPI0008AA1B37|nr:hypothetical protein [Mycobacteroides chelonae]OHT98300.1 hypothetical protein BKG71_19480 [Mycobacteroides chelonae]